MKKCCLSLFFSFLLLLQSNQIFAYHPIPFHFSLSLYDRNHFFSGVSETNDILFPLSYAFGEAIPLFATLPFFLSDNIKSVTSTADLFYHGEEIRHLTLKKLSQLEEGDPLFSKEDQFWLWRSLRGEDRVDTHNVVRRGVTTEKFYHHCLNFYRDVTHLEPTDSFKMKVDNLLRDLGYARLQLETRTLLQRLGLKIGDIENHHYEKLDQLLKRLKSYHFPLEVEKKIVHDFGWIHPNDLNNLSDNLKPFIKKGLNDLIQFRVHCDLAREELLEAVWLAHTMGKKLNLEKINEDVLLDWKLEYLKKNPELNILILERKIFNEWKKPLMAYVHTLKVQNQYWQVHGVSNFDITGLGLVYISGLGYTDATATTLYLQFFMANPEVFNALFLAGGVGNIAGGIADILISVLGASRDLPHYMQSKMNIKNLKRLLDHFDTIKTPDDQKIVQIKKIEIMRAMETQRQLKNIALNRLGLDALFVLEGGIFIVQGIQMILIALSVAAAISTLTPVTLSYSLLYMATVFPLAFLVYDYLDRMERYKDYNMAMGEFQGDFEESLNSPQFKENALKVEELYQKNPKEMNKLILNYHQLHKLQMKTMADLSSRSEDRFFGGEDLNYIANVINYKNRIKKYGQQLIETQLAPIEWQSLEGVTSLHVQRDRVDKFHPLAITAEKNKDPFWPDFLEPNLSWEDEISSATIFIHLADVYRRTVTYLRSEVEFKNDFNYWKRHSDFIAESVIQGFRKKVLKKKQFLHVDFRSIGNDIKDISKNVHDPMLREGLKGVQKDFWQWIAFICRKTGSFPFDLEQFKGVLEQDIANYPSTMKEFQSRYKYLSNFMLTYIPSHLLYPVEDEKLISVPRLRWHINKGILGRPHQLLPRR